MENKKKKHSTAKPPSGKTRSSRKSSVKSSGGQKKRGGGLRYLGGSLLSKMARGGAAELADKAEEVNRLNVFPVPDGDTGDNMRMTIESGIAAIEDMDSDNVAEVMRVLARGMMLGARGNSGVILSQFFSGVARGFEGVERADARTLAHALELGVEVAYSSVMTPTEGTILTVAREAVEYAVSRIDDNSTIRSFFSDLVDEMYRAVERTPEILTVLRDANVVDSGGAGLFYIMDGFNRVLSGKALPKRAVQKTERALPELSLGEIDEESLCLYGYCTELLLQLLPSRVKPEEFDIDELKKYLSEVGDSVVTVKDGSIVKLHVHTHTPEAVLGFCHRYGELLRVKIENMSLQHTESAHEKEDGEKSPDSEEKTAKTSTPVRKNAVITVAGGEGLISIFKSLGASEVIVGGQTMNPSTKDLLDACERAGAEHIFILPNNSNILLAAESAADIYTGATVTVIPTKSVGEGYAALSCASLDAEPEELEASMLAAIAQVRCVSLSPAVRDADIDGVSIRTGDTIAIDGKKIILSDPDRHTAAMKTAEYILSADTLTLEIFAGIDTTEAERSVLLSELRERYPKTDIYVYDGSQQVYPYIFVAE